MNMRHLFTRILTVGLLAATLAAAGTFKFELTDKVQAGQTQLQPGKYTLAIDGSTAVLKDKAGKTIDGLSSLSPSVKNSVRLRR